MWSQQSPHQSDAVKTVDILRFRSTVKICHFSVFYIFESEFLYVLDYWLDKIRHFKMWSWALRTYDSQLLTILDWSITIVFLWSIISIFCVCNIPKCRSWGWIVIFFRIPFINLTMITPYRLFIINNECITGSNIVVLRVIASINGNSIIHSFSCTCCIWPVLSVLGGQGTVQFLNDAARGQLWV